MNPGDAENDPRKQKNMQEEAKKAADTIIAQIQIDMAADLRVIQQESDPGKKSELEQSFRDKYIQRLNMQRLAKEASDASERSDRQDDFKEKSKQIKKSILEVNEVIKKTGSLTGKENVDKIVEGIAKKISTGELSDREIVDIEKIIGKHLSEGVVLGKEGGQKSDFDKDLDILKEVNHEAWRKIVDSLIQNNDALNQSKDQLTKKYDAEAPEDSEENMMRDPDLSRFAQDRQLYSKFTAEDQAFLQKLYKPETFIQEIVSEIEHKQTPKEVGELTNKILHIYDQADQPRPTQEKLDQELEKMIKLEVSEDMGKKLVDIMNKLYWRVHVERPHKFFEEIEKEDFMYGIETTRLKIISALERLQHTFTEMERSSEVRKMLPELYKHSEKDYYLDERNTGSVDKEGNPVIKGFMRTAPLPGFSKITMSQYLESLINNVNHWRHRSEYLHNARAIFNHPAHGDKGFYANLGGYAENLSGTDIDEMMLLPDGPMTYDAYMLYDKFVESEFAANDWKHRPNQFTNSLEEVNTKVEKEVIVMLQKLYPNESLDAVRHAVNAAVGMARGVFLTETEKSAYADAVDPKGGGMYASYATNDATALTTFNPMHVMLRWQGEHMLPMFYFMNVKGSGAKWDHADTWKNASTYLKAFIEGRGDLAGQDLFIDQLMDNMGVGGILKRKGWRTTYSLEGHNIYESDGKMNHLETFKAMDIIGYEAIYDFLKTKVEAGILKAEAGSKGAAKMDEMFKYIFDRYFVPLGETDYVAYMKKLESAGRKNAMDLIKHKGSIGSDTFEQEVNFQTAQIFIDNAIAREVALRFPSKYLKIDRDRFTKDGVSRYSKIQKELGFSRDKFNDVMKDFSFVEMLMRRKMSEYAKESSHLFPDLKLNNFNKFDYQINEQTIRELMEGKFEQQKINDVIKIFNKMKENYLNNSFLDKEGFKAINGYKFTFGIEDTDFSLMAMRSTGPRMIARSIGDIGQMESITPWIINMPRVLNQIATSGKHDFTPIIEYLQKAQNAFTMVHGTGDASDFKYIYKIASAVIQYFKKDSMAKPLFGLFRLGKRNSIAAEYAGRSTAVWEWDSREIDRFITTLESLRLLPKSAFNAQNGPTYVDNWVTILGKPVKIGKKMKLDYEFNGAKLRKEFGGDMKAISFDMLNQFLPIVLAFLLWKYFKDAMDEATGAKKK
jgi:hypothetical protein